MDVPGGPPGRRAARRRTSPRHPQRLRRRRSEFRPARDRSLGSRLRLSGARSTTAVQAENPLPIPSRSAARLVASARRGQGVEPFGEADVRHGRPCLLAILQPFGVLERALAGSQRLLLRCEPCLKPKHLGLTRSDFGFAPRELPTPLLEPSLVLFERPAAFVECGGTGAELTIAFVERGRPRGDLRSELDTCGIVPGRLDVDLLVDIPCLVREQLALGRKLSLGRLERRGSAGEIARDARDLFPGAFDLGLVRQGGACTLVELRPGSRKVVLARDQRDQRLLDLQLPCAQRGLALDHLAFSRSERIEPFLELLLASAQQFVRVCAVGVGGLRRRLGSANAKCSTAGRRPRSCAFELALAPLDVELAPCDLRRPVAEGALQLLQLDQTLASLTMPLLGQASSEAQELLTIRLAVPFGRVPAERLPRILGRIHGGRVPLNLAGLVESGWKEVTFGLVAIQLEPGRHDSAEEGRRPQGRQGDGAEELNVSPRCGSAAQWCGGSAR